MTNGFKGGEVLVHDRQFIEVRRYNGSNRMQIWAHSLSGIASTNKKLLAEMTSYEAGSIAKLILELTKEDA